MKIYFFSTKQERSEGNQKRVVYAREGRFSYLCVLLRFGNTLRLTPSSASPLPSLMKRMHSYKNLPYNKIGHTSASFSLSLPTKARILCLDSL